MGRHQRTKANLYQALDILMKGGQIRRQSASMFLIKSQSKGNWYHKVRWIGKRWSCDCNSVEKREHHSCEHIESVMLFLSLPSLLSMNLDPDSFCCPRCGGSFDNVTGGGIQRNKSGPVQRFNCIGCGYRFNDRKGFSKLKSNPSLIIVAVDLSVRGLSSREIESHLREVYGCATDHVTIHRWTTRYMKVLAKIEAKLIGRKKMLIGSRWHADEVVIKVGGRRAYLWAVLDYETRYLLASIVTNSRGAQAAERVINLAIKRFGKKRQRLVSDGLTSYQASIKKLNNSGRSNIVHVPGKTFQDRVNNNSIERFNKTIRKRVRAAEHFRRVDSANVFAKGFIAHYNLLRPHLALEKQTPAAKAKFNVDGSLRSLLLRQAGIRRREKRS